MKALKHPIVFIFVFLLLAGCAGVPVREAMKENLAVPAGKIEGNQFVGVRYPFKVVAPSNWKMSTDFPDFLEEWGYEKSSPNDREQTELYLFNPTTQSSLQIDFTPAGRYVTFSQEKIENLTTMATSSLTGEIEKDYGKDVHVEIGPTQAISLNGVQYAARKEVVYTAKGLKREQGWVYGFTEPYQIFILYMIVGNEPERDREAVKVILDSFEVVRK